MSKDINQLRRKNSSSEEEEELEDEKELNIVVTPHSCDYCLLSNVDCVARCIAKSCNRWFCNAQSKVGLGSHLILHLIKSKHREIVLHNDNRVGITNVECYVCENKNLFMLGSVNVKVDDEDNILILCRQPCLQQKMFNGIEWEPQDFEPIIIEKQVQDWMLVQPSEKMMKNTRHAPVEKISQLEELRKTQPNFMYSDLTKLEQKSRQLKECQLRYVDGKHYYQVFSPLIKLEEEQDKQMKESQSQGGINVRWEFSLKRKRLAYFFYASKEDFDTNLLLGNELLLSLRNHPQYPTWQSKGTVCKVLNNDEVCLELVSNDQPPPVNTGYQVDIIWKQTTFRRMQNGLKRFWRQEESISSFLYYTLLGQTPKTQSLPIISNPPINCSAPNLPDLNIYQIEAVQRALRSSLQLIQGPPGTGKTVTSATLVYQIVKSIQRGQVLVCAPSNIVVDQLAEKINMTGLKVVRLCSKMRESVSGAVEFLTLHSQIRSLDIPPYDSLNRFYQLLEDQGELNGKDEQQFLRLRDEAEREIIEQADVICTTCIGSQDPRLKNIKFQHVLIDEATQAVEPECLLPMLKGAKQVILVGDHRQLGPVVQSRLSARAGLDRSLFERLIGLGLRPVRLQVQYRMHPELTTFPSNTFYEGTLQNGVTISDRTHTGEFPWPNKQKPMLFINACGVEQISASGTSFLNPAEAAQIEKVVYYLVKSGVRAQQIGIITPYKGQRTYIVNYLVKQGQLNSSLYAQIEVASVDGFQGREKDFIIISCVRSNDGLGIGFLTNPRRLNVTLTRARYGLIICGNAKVLARDNLWNNLLNHFKDLNLLMEGSLPHLRESPLKFRAAQKYIPERRNNSMQDDPNSDVRSTYSYARSDNLNQFDNDLGEFPITQGVRNSNFGFTIIPDSQAFQKTSEQSELKKKLENIGTFKQEDVVIFSEDQEQPEKDIKSLFQSMGNFISDDFEIV